MRCAKVLIIAIFAVAHAGQCLGQEGVFPSGRYIVEPEMRFERVHGERDFEKLAGFGQRSTDYELGKSVAHLVIDQYYCTGFLVGRDLLLTNHHCMVDDAGYFYPKEVVRVYMDYWHESQKGEFIGVVDIVDSSEDLDFALLRLEESLGDEYGWLTLDASGSKPEEVKIIQHPRGRKKEIVRENTRVHDAPEGVLHYLADTEPGSSGSPVFDLEDTVVVALHHMGGGAANEGIPMSLIVPKIESWLTEDTVSQTWEPESAVATWILSTDHPERIKMQFYSQTRDGYVWPGAGRTYIINDGEKYSVRLRAQVGEEICFGAWDDSNTYWGVGEDDQHSCKTCCVQVAEDMTIAKKLSSGAREASPPGPAANCVAMVSAFTTTTVNGEVTRAESRKLCYRSDGSTVELD